MQDVSINKITLLKVLAQAIMVSWLLIQIFCEQFFITMTSENHELLFRSGCIRITATHSGYHLSEHQLHALYRRLDEVVFVAHIGVKAMLILALRFFFVSSLVHSIY